MMEMEAVHKEQTLMENQLASLRKQIANLTTEVEINKKRVHNSVLIFHFLRAIKPIYYFLLEN